jgi:DAK2 domain fusion protein YloV
VPTLERLDVHALRAVVTTFRDTVHAHAGGLNRLNVYPVPDGDTGTNMARTLEAVVTEMEAADDTLDATCDAISHGSLMGARGNSGVILSQIMRGIASTMREQAETSGARFADALSSAASGAYRAVLRPIEGTILTVVRESAEAARTVAGEGATLVEVVRAARDAGREALDRTPELLPVLADAGVVDAGGAGYLLLLDAAMHIVDGSPLPEPDDSDGPAMAFAGPTHTATSRLVGGSDVVDVADQRFEVMYLCELADDRIEAFKEAWGAIGDSIVVVGGEGMWNCHVHTNDIGAAIEVALDLDGRPSRIRVTDLFDEVDAEHERREAEMSAPDGATAHVPSRAGAGQPRVTTAIVAVSSGPGLDDLFSALRVQGIVSGGQTLNPSTAELLDVVEHVNADQVVILPNNSNIIPVAEQIDGLTSKRVVVVPTRTMPQALAALITYDPESDAETNAHSMGAAANEVRTGEVTTAVRDSRSDVGPVTEGDWIGIVKGDGIAVIGITAEDVCLRLLDHLLADGGELITVVTGADADQAVIDRVLAELGTRAPSVDVEVHHGGQPLYPFLFGVE